MVKESGPRKKHMAYLTLKSIGRFNECIIDKVWRGCREMQIVQCPKANNNSRVVSASRSEAWGQAVTGIERGELCGEGWLQRNHLWWSDSGMEGDPAGKHITGLRLLPPITCWTFYWPPQPETNGKEVGWYSSHESNTQRRKQGKEG